MHKYIKPIIYGIIALAVLVFIIILVKSCNGAINLDLNNLQLTGGQISPKFKPEITKYNVTTESALLYIECSTVNEDAKTNGCGYVDLSNKEGETYVHTIEIYQDDNKKEYILEIVVPEEFSAKINKLVVMPDIWTKDPVKLQIIAVEGIDLAEEPYSFDNGVNWQKEDTMEYENNEYVEARIKDIYGNVSPLMDYEIINIDNQPPVVSLNPNGGKYEISSGDETDIDITIDIDENESGVAVLKYGWTYSDVEKPKDLITFTAGETITSKKGTGTYYLWIYTEDKVGNKNDFFVSSSYTILKDGVSTPTEYMITYDANGGSNAPTAQTKVRDTSLQLTKSAPTRSGYDFIGWGTSKDSAIVAYTPGASYTKNESIVLYAIWQDNSKITINYNGNGATISKKNDKITPGTNVTLPTITRDGFQIIGWSTNKNDTTASYSSGGTAAFNLGTTLYAITKKDVTITFNKINGAKGIGGTTEAIITKNCTIKNSANSCSVSSPTIEVASQWSALGWSLTNNSNTVDLKVNVSFATTNSTAYYTVTKSEKTYIVTFDKNTATAIGETKVYCTTPASYNGVVRNTSCTVVAPTIKADGKIVVGWSKDRNATTSSYPPGSQISISANTTYYAITK